MSTPISTYAGNVQATQMKVLDRINFATNGVLNGYIISANTGDDSNCNFDFFVTDGFGGFVRTLHVDNDSVQIIGELDTNGDAFLAGVMQAGNGVQDANGNKILQLQQPSIPDADAGTLITTVNAILAALRAHGLIAT